VALCRLHGESVNKVSGDFCYTEIDDPEQILSEILRQAACAECQVLSPKKDGLLGTQRINQVAVRLALHHNIATPIIAVRQWLAYSFVARECIRRA